MLQYYDISLFVDEAQYWLWSKKLDWGYFSKPPLTAWTIYLTSSILGDNPFGVRIASLLYYMSAMYMVYILSKKIYGYRTATWTVLSIASMPLAALCPFMTTDAPLFFFWSLSLLIFYNLYKNHDKRPHCWIILGIIWG